MPLAIKLCLVKQGALSEALLKMVWVYSKLPS